MNRRSSLQFPLIFLVLGFTSAVSSQEVTSESTIHKLRQHLLKGYDVNSRPVQHHSNSTLVSVSFMPTHITRLNEQTGILTLEVWIYLGWKDEHLKWKPDDFSGIESLILPDTEIWKPDISILEGRGSKIGPWHPVQVEVNNEGKVNWFPSATLEVVCGDFDYSQYPFDTQTCTVSLGSWAHDARSIDLLLVKAYDEDVSLVEYYPYNPHWKIISGSGNREEKLYSEHDPAPYIWIEYHLEIKRQNVPFSSLGSSPNTVARILFLCMFWLASPVAKYLFGCTSMILLTCIAVGITVSLPSPAAAPSALYSVTVSMALCITALIVEIAVSSLASCTLGLPTWFHLFADSKYIRYFTPCNVHPAMPSKSGDKTEIIEDASGSRKVSPWPLVSTLIDRIAFLIFAVLLLTL